VSKHDRITRARKMKRACVLIEAAQADSDDGDGAGAGSERNGHRSRIRTVTRTHFASPPHGRGTPLVRALALQGVSGDSGSHLGSTLNPGGAVLTLGVFRRSRSVAYIPADASPSEVLASAIVPPRATVVNPTRRDFALYCGRRMPNSTLRCCSSVAAGPYRVAVSAAGLSTACALRRECGADSRIVPTYALIGALHIKRSRLQPIFGQAFDGDYVSVPKCTREHLAR
jgi:hypothetical protein